MTMYRPHRGSLAQSMGEVVEVKDFDDLVRHMRSEVAAWYPKDKLPTVDNVTIELCGHDHRTRWETYFVMVDGGVWGFMDGPIKREGGQR